MPPRLWRWIFLQSGSVMFSVFGVFLLFTEGDVVMLLWIPVALGLWFFRPKDWRDALH